LARLRHFGKQLHQPLDFSNQEENNHATGTPNYALCNILVDPSETLILGDGGYGIPPSPPNPYPPPSERESSDEGSSSSEQSQNSNNSQTSAQMNNQNNTARPWLDQYVVAIPKTQHPLPNHTEKWLPKFDPDSKQSAEDHIKKFMLVFRLRNVEHEDVV
jgi:hypothetical protein